MAAQIALLRGINVGGHRPIPMADLRRLAAGLGFEAVQTYIQSGNLIYQTDLSTSEAENALEAGILAHFGFAVDTLVRTGAQWARYATGTPYPEAEAERPHLVMLALARHPLSPGAEATLQGYAQAGERITRAGDALWIDYAGGSARSKITPAVLDRAAGSPVTTRSWRTVQALADRLRAS